MSVPFSLSLPISRFSVRVRRERGKKLTFSQFRGGPLFARRRQSHASSRQSQLDASISTGLQTQKALSIPNLRMPREKGRKITAIKLGNSSACPKVVRRFGSLLHTQSLWRFGTCPAPDRRNALHSTPPFFGAVIALPYRVKHNL